MFLIRLSPIWVPKGAPSKMSWVGFFGKGRRHKVDQELHLRAMPPSSPQQRLSPPAFAPPVSPPKDMAIAISPASPTASAVAAASTSSIAAELQQSSVSPKAELALGQVRTNGFDLPFSRDQIISWTGHIISASCFYAAVVLCLVQGKSVVSARVVTLVRDCCMRSVRKRNAISD